MKRLPNLNFMVKHMNRFKFIALTLLAVGLVNGCSKCSREEMPPPPPTPPPTDESVMPNMPAEEMESPADAEPEQDQAAPVDQNPADSKESTD